MPEYQPSQQYPQATPAITAPTDLLNRVNALEKAVSDIGSHLGWAHERIAFLESAIGTSAQPSPSKPYN
jgi:hypothetical protein